MKSPQSHINSRRLLVDRAADTAPRLIIACGLAICGLAVAVVLGAAMAAIPQLDAVLDQAEQLRRY